MCPNLIEHAVVSAMCALVVVSARVPKRRLHLCPLPGTRFLAVGERESDNEIQPLSANRYHVLGS